MLQYTRPWSLAHTPVIPNPRREGRRLPITTGLDEFQAIMDSPSPWPYVDSGFVLWEGPSPIDGAPIVAIVTGVADKSGNVKTGAMLQTWILRQDLSPQEAVDTGADVSICGACVHRGFELSEPRRVRRRVITPAEAALGYGIAGGPPARREIAEATMAGRTCYVAVSQAPMSVWKAYHRGVYPRMSVNELPLLGHGRLVRLGTYGDPAMVPLDAWRALVLDSVGWTGYTHQWCEPGAQPYRELLMASVDDEGQMRQAQGMGWRTFRVLRGDQQLVAGLEITCPASREAGFTKTCDACRACQGVLSGKKPWRERPGVPSVAIRIHPHWQVLYWPRGKKGRRVRAHRVSDKPTELDPAKRPSEVVLADYVAQAEVSELARDLKRAERSSDPAAEVAAFRHKYPGYLQSYLDHAAQVLAGRGQANPPPSPARLRAWLEAKRAELDDAVYFGYPPEEVARIEHELRDLQRHLAQAEGAFEEGVRGGYRQTIEEERRAEHRRRLRRNPLLAIVGNPYVDPLAFEARERYREDLEAGHLGAAEYWRGQAGAFFTGGKAPKRVAGPGVDGRVKSPRKRTRKKTSKKASKKNASKKRKQGSKVIANRVAPKSRKKPREKKKRVSLSEARRRFEGYEEALDAYKEFHGEDPDHVNVFMIDDGRDEVTVEPVHAALHRTLETNYVVPWKSNKRGTLWLHEHKEGAGLKGLQKGARMPRPEDLPLEVYDPRTKTTRKIGGRFQIRDWWFD